MTIGFDYDPGCRCCRARVMAQGHARYAAEQRGEPIPNFDLQPVPEYVSVDEKLARIAAAIEAKWDATGTRPAWAIRR